MVCAPSEDSDQPEHPPSLIRVFAVLMKKARVLIYPLSAQWRLWSDWADTKADLSLHWAQIPFCCFCHERLKFQMRHNQYIPISKFQFLVITSPGLRYSIFCCWECQWNVNGIQMTTSYSENTISNLSQLMRLWYLSHRRSAKAQASLRIRAQSHQSLRCSHTWSIEVDEVSDQKLDIQPHWMAAHAHFKNVFTEDEKCQNLMTWLISTLHGWRKQVIYMEITSPIPFNQDTSGPVFKNMNNVLKLNMKMTRILIHKKKSLIYCLPV